VFFSGILISNEWMEEWWFMCS